MRGPCRSSRIAADSRRPWMILAQLGDPARPDLGRAVRGVDADDVDARRRAGRSSARAGPTRGPAWRRSWCGERRVRHRGSLMSARHRCITTSPADDREHRRPARKAAPSPRSTAGSTAQATRSASIPGGEACRGAGRVPAALRGAQRCTRGPPRRSPAASPRAASRRPAPVGGAAAPAPRRRPRADRSTPPARRSRRRPPCRARGSERKA